MNRWCYSIKQASRIEDKTHHSSSLCKCQEDTDNRICCRISIGKVWRMIMMMMIGARVLKCVCKAESVQMYILVYM